MNQSSEPRKMSRELRAVLHIFNADAELRAKALPWVNIGRERIEWEKIWNNDFGGGHAAAVVWVINRPQAF